jgi:hypothetical protein
MATTVMLAGVAVAAREILSDKEREVIDFSISAT